jgi:hypothetical protein
MWNALLGVLRTSSYDVGSSSTGAGEAGCPRWAPEKISPSFALIVFIYSSQFVPERSRLTRSGTAIRARLADFTKVFSIRFLSEPECFQ